MTETADLSPATELEAIETLADRYGEAWNSQDLDAILALHSAHSLFHLHAGAEPVQGIDAIRATFAAFLEQWPDIHFEQQSLATAPAGWVLQSTMSGTLASTLELEGEVVGRPGSKIAVDAVDVIAVSDGLVAAKHTYLDSVTLLRQLAEGA
jgi:steroid delta-isomerase-like uncharacterized protein